MYNVKDIVNALHSGATPEELAERFSDTLNKAVEVQKAEEAKRAEEQERKAAQRAAVKAIVDAIADYYKNYGDKETYDLFAGWSENVDEKGLDSFARTLNSFAGVGKLLDMPILFTL